MDYYGSQQARTPSWMVALLTIFSISTLATLGAWLYQHAQKAAYLEQFGHLYANIRTIREVSNTTAAEIPPLENQVLIRRQHIVALEKSDEQAKADIDRKLDEGRAHLKAIGDDIDKEKENYASQLKDMNERREELAREEQHAMTSEHESDEKRLAMREKIEKISQAIEEVKKKGRQDNAERDVRIALLTDRVTELTQQREIDTKDLRSAGQILQSRAADGFVVINRGHRNNLRNGTRFSVYSRRAGKNIIKGQIEVIKVEDQISVARVLKENDGNNPIIVNDNIANPIFDPDKIKGFAIYGDFTQFSKDELKHFILESGGRFDDELTTNTDYLVAGEHSEEALRKAIKLGVSILSEEQLIESQLFRLPVSDTKK
jgi:hypothetical protein